MYVIRHNAEGILGFGSQILKLGAESDVLAAQSLEASVRLLLFQEEVALVVVCNIIPDKIDQGSEIGDAAQVLHLSGTLIIADIGCLRREGEVIRRVVNLGNDIQLAKGKRRGIDFLGEAASVAGDDQVPAVPGSVGVCRIVKLRFYHADIVGRGHGESLFAIDVGHGGGRHSDENRTFRVGDQSARGEIVSLALLTERVNADHVIVVHGILFHLFVGVAEGIAVPDLREKLKAAVR